MKGPAGLHQLLERAAERWPQNVAVQAPSGATVSYAELTALSARVCDRLARLGAGAGERVGICLPKSIDAVAAIFGALKAGAAYVPVDAQAPPARNAYIFSDCGVKAIVVEAPFADALRNQMAGKGPLPSFITVERADDGRCLDEALAAQQQTTPEAGGADGPNNLDDLAYILYTSGSTGSPKGVMLSHRNALSFVDWCGRTFEPTERDRFSSHAPFHFDLSILDIFVPLMHGAMLVLIDHETGKDPAHLAALIAEQKITIWYSTPSILSLLVQHGDLSDRDCSSLRTVLFAGEVFPVKHLRMLKELLPHPRYFNLYGPTETNVCTFHEIPARIPADRTEPYPIGKCCDHLGARVVGANDQNMKLEPGTDQTGELCIQGPAVTRGYWNLAQQTEAAFLTDERGQCWYRTGDLVALDENGDYLFRGRRDRMVKKRGYRIELGEIEACLYRHEMVRQAAVIAQSDDDGVTIKAFVSTHDGKKLSTIALKRFCAEHLPLYMVPDRFVFRDSLPTTSTDKIDYQALRKPD